MKFEDVKKMTSHDLIPPNPEGSKSLVHNSVIYYLKLSGVECKYLCGGEDELAYYLIKKGQSLTEDELACCWRSYGFSAEFEEGTKEFLVWDTSNSTDIFMCELDVDAIRSVIKLSA